MQFDLTKAGEVLREAREGRGLSVEQVSNALYLRKSMILAMESADWARLPHPVYVKGYVTQYAAFLDVQDRVSPALAASVPKAEQTQEVEPVRAKRVRQRVAVSGDARRRLVLLSSLGVLVLAFFVIQSVQTPTYNLPQQPLHPVQPVSRTVPSASVNEDGEKTVLETKKLVIACQERTWVRIIIDETEKKEFMLNPEEMVMFTGKERFDLLIGNAGGVRLYYNGKESEFTGQTGEVKRITFS